jgi:leucyl-tRNA synthetase
MDDDKQYRHQEIEEKWQNAWKESGLDTPDILQAKKPYYNLMMFPYPSAEGLHVGNMYAFTGSDIFGRWKRMQGYDVFEPIGLDGFGIHSENFALKIGRHPMDHAAITQKNYYNQLHKIGAMYDWTRTVETYDPDYYRITQWLFVQMFKHGLAYRDKAQVNWCPGCKTVLADEQVVVKKATPLSGEAAKGLEGQEVCERCGKTVEKRELEQWFFRITAYAEKLLQNSVALDWAKNVKVAQQSWIGKKEGITITYPVVDSDGRIVDEVTCFTTRPDTNFGATFVAIAPEHPLVGRLFGGVSVSSQSKGVPNQINPVILGQIHDYVESAKRKSAADRAAQGRKKTGVFTGFYAVNGLNGATLPLYISDFVLADFGTGAVVGVPGHDQRDFAFAIQFDIEVKRVVVAPDGDTSPISRREQVQEDAGVMINSEFLNGLPIQEAIRAMMDHLEKTGMGKRVTTYHLRDWLISRQRYWGPPIPMIYCAACAKEGRSWFTTDEAQSQESGIMNHESGGMKNMPGWYPVPEDQLPVILPRIEDYKPGDDGVAPLAKHKEFYETICPACRGKAVRETDVSDTFLDSSWYFLRYPSIFPVIASEAKQSPANAGSDAHSGEIASSSVSWRAPRNDNQTLPWDPSVTKKWLPVSMYTGGAEHSVLHLMYSRFVAMALHDWGYTDFDEPFTVFYAHGLVIKDGAKMSKSKGNVVNPDEYIARYGADALRLYLMFTGPYDQGGDFRDSAMEGMARWVQRVWKLATDSIAAYGSADSFAPSDPSKQSSQSTATLKKSLHRAIKKVGEDIERRRYNTAISAMMILVNDVSREGGFAQRDDLLDFLKILAPFAPFMTEELYRRARAGAQRGRSSSDQEPKETKGKTVSQYTFTISDSIHVQPWPVYDASLLAEDTVAIAVQVNGKLRETIQVQSAKCKVQSEVEEIAKASARVARYLGASTVQKVIFIPGKLVNFVV